MMYYMSSMTCIKKEELPPDPSPVIHPSDIEDEIIEKIDSERFNTVADGALAYAWIKSELDNGKYLILPPHIYDLCPQILKDHPNCKRQKKIQEML